jgi:hypothetical protein
VIETAGGAMLRTVVPFRNREALPRMPRSRARINGIMLLDKDVGAVRAAMNRDLRWMVAGTGGLVLLLIVAGLAGMVRVVVLRRLSGSRPRRASSPPATSSAACPLTGSDTVSWLAPSSTRWPTR